MSSTFTEVLLEHRDGDDMQKAKYNIYTDPEEQKEYFVKTKGNKTEKKTRTGKSKNRAKWDITEYVGDKRTEKTEDYSKNDFESVLGDFGIDVKPMFKGTTKEKSAPKKALAKKKSTKKKSTKKGGAKKKSTKKGGAKKKSRQKKG